MKKNIAGIKSNGITLLTVAAYLYLLGAYGNIATAQTLTAIHWFSGSDGFNPPAGLAQGSDGNFYGTTYDGGASGYGTVFQISLSGTLTNLHSFSGSDGAHPRAGLARGSDGNFYGTTYVAGASNYGTVFQISPSGDFTNLYSFSGTDGQLPVAGLVQGSDGNFYGTTSQGGNTNLNSGAGYGAVFRISPSGDFTNLYSFSGSDGANPQAGLVQGSDGNFYGTTQGGGTSANCSGGCGTVFRISPSGSLTTLHSFTGTDGQLPAAGLLQGSDGNFYGTTQGGGTSANCSGGCGTVFRISPSGDFTSLYSFSGYPDDGALPTAGLARGSDGNFYGTTYVGGASSYGTVFQISPSGSLTNLHSFSGYPDDGALPNAGLVQGIDGNFYGTTSVGGPSSYGIVFKIFVPLNPPANQVAGMEFFSVFGDTGVAFLIPSVAGETYQLQYSDSMNPAHWCDTGGCITSSGGPLTLFDLVGALPRQRFYRAAVTP